MRNSSLALRFGYVDFQATLLHASVIAAHAISDVNGFRATDVRFFFRLFGNWLEVDVLHPSQDIQLVQVSRVLKLMEADEHLIQTKVRFVRYKERRVRLTPDGLLTLAERLVDECIPSFPETLFVLHFAASYRDILRARVVAAGDRLSPTARRRLGMVLDPKRILKRAIQDNELLIDDLRGRLELDRDFEAEVEHLRSAKGDVDITEALTKIGAYQLERVQPLKQLHRMLPPDLKRFELAFGVKGRREMIFQPLLQRCELELELLRNLASKTAGES